MPKKIILFVPGYYGTRLQDEKSGKIRWAKTSNFLFSQTGVSDEIPGTKIGSTNKLIATDILKHVKILPQIWQVDSYGKTLEQLEAYAQSQQMVLETVSYDWRDDFVNSLKAIDNKIKNLNLETTDELHVVAHSLGALLMAYYIRYGAQDVETAQENWAGLKHISKLALVAPPLHGLMILFRDIEYGTRLGLNQTLLSGRDYSTFKSSYFFLPPKGEDIGISLNEEKISIGIHNVDNWEKNKWGPFKFASTKEVDSTRKFVEKYMQRSEKFHSLLRTHIINPPLKKMPLLHLRGLGHKTLEFASMKIVKNRIAYDFNKKNATYGDGTVTEKSGAPLSFFSVFDLTSIDTKFGHLDILAKSEAQSIIHNFLNGN